MSFSARTPSEVPPMMVARTVAPPPFKRWRLVRCFGSGSPFGFIDSSLPTLLSAIPYLSIGTLF